MISERVIIAKQTKQDLRVFKAKILVVIHHWIKRCRSERYHVF